ncbi:tape measure protein [Larkinella soli]|uniref:tape measure protein n=1 Tax=Larkinella soli TaxID=1770527 RepID=UPI000FFBB1EB|nr:tape measure protein [Larkinella soli]
MERRLTVEITLDPSDLERGANRAEGRIRRLGQSAQSVGQQMDRGFKLPMGSLNNFVGGLLSMSAAIAAAKQGLQIVSDFQRMDTSLKAVSSSAQDYARTQNFLKATADQYGLSIESLSNAYKGLKAASNGTALQGEATEKIFLAVSKASAALQLSSDQTEGALLALSQMMSKGTVSAEELRGQLGERIPGAFGLFAKAAGVSEQQLGKMLEQGQVAASDVLPKFAEQLERVYGANAQANVNTMAGQWQRATDQIKLLVSEFSQTAGIDTFFAKLGKGIASFAQGLRALVGGKDFLALRDLLNPRLAATKLELFGANAGRVQDFKIKGLPERIKEFEGVQQAIEDVKTELEVTDWSAIARLKRGPFSRTKEEVEAELTSLQQLLKDYSRANAELRRQERGAGNAPVIKPSGGGGTTKTTKEHFREAYTISDVFKKQLDIVEKQIADFKAKNPGVEVPVELRMKQGFLQDRMGIADKTDLPFVQAFQHQIEGLGKWFETNPALPGMKKFFEGLNKEAEKQKDAFANILMNMAEDIRYAGIETAMSAAEGFGQIAVSLFTGTQSALKQILSMGVGLLADYLNKVAQSKIIAGLAMIAAGAVSLDPFLVAKGKGNLKAGAGLKLASGLVRGMGNMIPQLATGGAATGPTLAMIGDNYDARINPEYVLRGDQVNTLLDKYGGGGGGLNAIPDTVRFIARGQDLEAVLQMRNREQGG